MRSNSRSKSTLRNRNTNRLLPSTRQPRFEETTNMKFQITNHKSQTNLKSKYPNSKHVWNLVFGVWNFRSLHANGYAALTTLILTLAVSLTVIGGFTFFSLKEVTVTRAYTRSLEARTIAESGIEDGRSEEHTSELQSHVNIVC